MQFTSVATVSEVKKIATLVNYKRKGFIKLIPGSGYKILHQLHHISYQPDFIKPRYVKLNDNLSQIPTHYDK